jgi:lipopolysaccharide/colanic/teichoic acid biosynthesis glycosyltransferase
MTERVKADVYYVEHWSVALDLKIMLATLLRARGWV